MHSDDERNIYDNEIEELAQQFRQAVDAKQSIYFDLLDLEDIIGYFLDTDEMDYCKKAIALGLHTYPLEPFIRILRVKYYTMLNKFKDAENEITYIENHFSPFPELYVEKVMLAHATNKNVDAIGLLKKALALDKTNPEIHLLCALEYIDQQNLEQALQYATRAINLEPDIAGDLATVSLNLQILFKDKQLFASKFYTALTEEFPLSGNLWNGLGVSLLSLNRYEEALDAFQNQLAIDDQDGIIYMNIGEAYFGMEKYDIAIKYFKIADDKCVGIQFDLQIGRCFYAIGDYDTALKYFRIAFNDPAMRTFAIPEITRTLIAQGKSQEARTFLIDNFNDSTQETEIIEDLLDLLNPETDYDEMLALCRSVIESSEDRYDFFDFFVRYCCDNEYFDFGIEVCKEALEQKQTDYLYYFLAALYLLDNQYSKGCDHLEKALILSPENLFSDFLDISENLKDIPQVADLVSRYQDPEDTH